jgi:hypothetical protein
MQNQTSRFTRSSAFVLSALLACAGSVAAAPVTDISNTYTWKPLKTGAGGWVTGIDIHRDGQVVYARTDTGGALRWTEATRSWTQIVTAQSMPDEAFNTYGGLNSLVAAPSDANRVYMQFGASIYRSANRGTSWVKTGFNAVGNEANGEGRQQGERLAVDPLNADVVFYGSNAQGLWVTLNAGALWTQVPAAQVPPSAETVFGVGNVMFDANSGSLVVGGVARTRVVYATVHQKGIYRSDNAGQTWRKISGGAAGPTDTARFQHIDIAADGTLYVAMYQPSALWKYQAGVWTNVTPPGIGAVVDVAVSPFDANKVFAFQEGGQPFRSTTAGAAWVRLEKTQVSTDIPWFNTFAQGFMSIGNVVFDPKVPDRLWVSEGVGVWRSNDINDGELTWTSVSLGIEQLVSNDVVAPPGGKPVTAHWDFGLFHHANPDAFPPKKGPTSRFNSAWTLAYSWNTPSFVVATVSDHRFCCETFDGPDNQASYSLDGGVNWTLFPSLANRTHPFDLRFGDIAVASNDINNIVWLPTFNKALHYSRNRGATWTPVILPGTENILDDQGAYAGGSHFNFFLNRKVLTADTALPNTFYLYHQDRGIYRSTNGGANWTLLPTTGLPKGFAVGYFNATLKAVPGKAGHLFFSPGPLEGEDFPLYRSVNGGANWSVVADTLEIPSFGFGKAAPGASFPTLFMQGRVNGDPGVWRSTDEGASWQKIATFPMGIFDEMKAMDGDKDIFGRVYTGFAGTGFAYGDAGTTPPPTGNEIILDNLPAGASDATRRGFGKWCVSPGTGKYGADSLYSCGTGLDTYRWTPSIPSAGNYQVYVWWSALASNGKSTGYTVKHASGAKTVFFDQSTGGGRWVLHGTYPFAAGSTNYVQMNDSRGQAAADAVRFVPMP